MLWPDSFLLVHKPEQLLKRVTVGQYRIRADIPDRRQFHREERCENFAKSVVFIVEPHFQVWNDPSIEAVDLILEIGKRFRRQS